MKKILILFLFIFAMASIDSAKAQRVDAENQTLYLLHFGRGAEGNSVTMIEFYNFLNSAFKNTNISGITAIDSKGHRFNDESVFRENTTIVEIIGDSAEMEEKVSTLAEQYCMKFEHKNVEVFIAKINNVSTSMFD